MFFSKHRSRVLTLVLVGYAAFAAQSPFAAQGQAPDWPHATFQAPVVVAAPEVLPASFTASVPQELPSPVPPASPLPREPVLPPETPLQPEPLLSGAGLPVGADVPAGMGMWSVGAPHLVLRPHAPAALQHAGHLGHATSHRQHVAGPRPALPGATTLPLQKTPYSYGYFGAVPRQHWSLHFGHQQNYTQWRQR